MNKEFMPVFLTPFRLLLIVASFTFLGSAQSATYQPHEIKAVYLYKIANFVKWPNESKRDHLNICFQGNFNVQRTFFKITKNKTIRGMTLALGDAENPCDLVYIADRFTSDTFSNTQLVIGDKKGFVERGGFIELSQKNGKIQPVINLSRVDKSTLKISSKLMNIATLVDIQ